MKTHLHEILSDAKTGQILYVGDIHGNAPVLAAVLNDARVRSSAAVVQVGDLGVHWPRPSSPESPVIGAPQEDPLVEVFETSNAAGGPPFYFCDGNHDHHAFLRAHPPLIAPGCRHMRRAECIDVDGIRHVFFGGAHSSDFARRTEGINWWPDELPSEEELHEFVTAISNYRPEVIVTHEAPAFAAFPTERPDGNLRLQLREACEAAAFWPKRWFFGHHHMLRQWDDPVLPTRFFCCGLHGEGWFLDGQPFRPPLLTRSFHHPRKPPQ